MSVEEHLGLGRGDIRDCGIVKWLKKGLDHAVELVYSDLLICGVVFQLYSWLLSPCSRFQRSFFQQQFLKIIRGIEVGLFA